MLLSSDFKARIFLKFSTFIVLVLLVVITGTHVCSGFPPLKTVPKLTQKSENQEQKSPIDHPEDITKRIKEIQGLLKQYKSTEEKNLPEQVGITISDINSRNAKLQELKASYESFLSVLKNQTALKKTEEVTRDKINKNQLTVSEKPPYSLSFYDQVKDQLNDAEQQKETLQLAKKLAKRTLEDAQTRLEEAQKATRNLKDQVAQKGENAPLSKLKWDLESANINEELAGVTVNLLRLRLKNIEKQMDISSLNIENLKQNLKWVRKNLHFDKNDLQNQLDSLNKKRDELRNRIKKLLIARNKAERSWLQAQKILIRAKNQDDIATANAYLKAKGSWRETYQRVSEEAENEIQLINQMEDLWKKRYEIIEKKINQQQLETWKEDAETNIENLDRTLTLQQSYQTDLQAELGSIQKRLSTENIQPKIRKYISDQLEAVEEVTKRGFEYLSLLLATKRMNERLLDQIKSKHQEISLEEKISVLGDKAKKIWNFELWVMDSHSVTVKKFVIAVFILIGGILLLKSAMRVLKKRLFPKTHLDPSAAAALEKIVHYFGIILVALFALRVVNIPLTAFTFLGGAIAIGVGFGAQNLINNFISGFIIMAERPIKIGDLIEVEGLLCRVEEIGARCTKIRTAGNKNILVPNSSFLEKNITNWTFGDHNVRSKIRVGIAYGSSVRDAERLLLQAVQEHKRVLRDPKPFVIFRDFGDSALIFEVYFWLRIYKFMEREQIESDIRFRIDNLFKEAGIVISFPQTDVHMDTLKPLEFKLIDTKDNIEMK